MNLILYTMISMALAADVNKAFYLAEHNATCTWHESTGGTSCEPGHLYDALTVRIPSFSNHRINTSEIIDSSCAV